MLTLSDYFPNIGSIALEGPPMPQKLHWTQAQDSQIKRLRAEGASWDVVAAALGMSRWTVIDRGHRIGACRPPRQVLPRPEDSERAPLAAGHPRTWSILTAGTVLEGTPYPLPCFYR
jgi:hypothetical protein